MLRFRLWCFSATLAAVSISLSGCGHGSKGGLPPVPPSSHAAADAVRPDVVYESVQAAPDQEDAQMRADRVLSGSTSYLASVKTLPAIVTQPSGAVYNPDDGNYYIVAANPTSPFQSEVFRVSKTGATSTFASFSGPAWGIAYDHANRTFYVTSGSSYNPGPAIYKVTKAGAVSILAGGGSTGHTDGSGSAATFIMPTGITLDVTNGALYAVDSDRIRKITPAGTVTTLTAAGSIGPSNGLGGVGGIVYDKTDGRFYVADAYENIIRRVSKTGAVTTLAGQCVSESFFASCAQLQRDGEGTKALFASPTGIAADPANGSLYIADSGNNAIRHITLAGNVTTFAGNGLPEDADGAGMRAELNSPRQLTVGAGGLLVLEWNQSISTSAVRTVTITGTQPPPLTSRLSLIDSERPGAPLYAIDWRKGTTASPTLWYSETDGHVASLTTSGVSTEYAVGPAGGQFGDILVGNDGTPWVYNSYPNELINRKADGSTATVALSGYSIYGGGPDYMAVAPNGDLWVAAQNTLNDVSPSGSEKTFPENYSTIALAVDGKGDVWTSAYPMMTEYSSAGAVLHTYNYTVQHLTTGSDGNIWFTQNDAVGKINVTTGIFTVYPLVTAVPNCPSNSICSRDLGAIAQGADGALWFVEQGPGMIGRITTSGAFTEYQIYAAHKRPFDIVPGPDGNIWFTDPGSEKIGKVSLKGL